MGSGDTVLSNLFEKLFHLNQKLEVQEDDIFRLTLQMEAMLQARNSGEPCLTEEQESILHTELQVAQEELDTMAKLNSRLGYEIKRNELALTNMMKNYDGRQQFARRLEQDVTRAEVGTCTTTQQPSITPLSSPSTSSSSPHQGLNRIEEETDWEEGCESEEDEESDDEELRVHGHCVSGGDLPFPVLAPPEQFQNCLSPSATYESGCMRVAVASPAYSNSNDSVSSALSSSTATEKSVRFSDRDQILSTPEPRQSGPAWLPQVHRAESHRSLEAGHGGVRVKSILKPEHQTCTKNYVGGVAPRGVGGQQHEVTSFLLDTEDGTLV